MIYGELTVIRGPSSGISAKVENGNEIIIGRQDCTLGLDDYKVSRKHASFKISGSDFKLTDLDSSNGTFLNGKRIKFATVKHKDLIEIGQSAIIFYKTKEKYLKLRNELSADTVMLNTGEINSMMLGLTDDEAKLDKLRRAKTDLSAIYRVGQEICSIRKTGELYSKASEIILRELKKTDYCSLHITDENENELICVNHKKRKKQDSDDSEYKFSTEIIKLVLDEMKAILIRDTKSDNRVNSSKSIAKMRICSAMCVPIQTGNRLLGIMQAGTFNTRNMLLEDDLKLFAAIGIQFGALIENAMLYEKLEKEKNTLAQANRKLKTLQDNLIRSEKLAAIGQLTAGIIHDVRNPLSIIMGHAELLRHFFEQCEVPEMENIDAKDSVKNIRDGVRHCSEVIGRLLQFSRQSPPQKMPVRINEIIEGTVAFIKHELKKNSIGLKKSLSDEISEVEVDENQIKQTLLNIMFNAIQAMEKNGVMEISSSLEKSGENSFAVIKIKDNGCGMPDEVRNKIFDPFFTTKKSTDPDSPGGTGLGLSVGYGIIQNHGGEIDVESTPGSGSTFTITLPLVRNENA